MNNIQEIILGIFFIYHVTVNSKCMMLDIVALDGSYSNKAVQTSQTMDMDCEAFTY